MFRDNLKDLLECKCLTVKELSEKTGINKRTLDTYVDKRAVIPNAEIAVKLAQALDTSVEYLVTGKNIEKTDVVISFSKDINEIINESKKMTKNQLKALLELIKASLKLPNP